jgi:phosphotransferase system, enzyme I, PtsP
MPDASIAYEIIRTVTRTMVESRDTQPALDAVVRLISQKMQVNVCSIYLFDKQDGVLELRASHGLNRDQMDSVTMSPEEGLTGHVYSRGELLNIASPRQDHRFKYFPALGEEHLNNFMGIPIPPGRPHGRGVLILQSVDNQAFPSVIEDLAYTLAAQLGTLIDSRDESGMAGRVGTSTLPKNTFSHDDTRNSATIEASISALVEAMSSTEGQTFIRAQVAIGGIAEGKVSVLRTHQVWDSIIFAESETPEEELQVLRKALELAREESRWLRQRASEIFAELDARIFDVHEMMLSDEHYIGLIESHIREKMTAPFSVKIATRELCRSFLDSGVAALASRAADLKDVGLRLINALGEVRDHRKAEDITEEGVVVAAVELLPSDLIYLQSRRIVGILCETGGVTSHAAILARSLGIPCFMGVPGLTRHIHNGTPVILDGHSGLIYIRPDVHVQREYRRLLQDLVTEQPDQKQATTRTLDGVEVQLSANVSLLSDLELMQRHGIQDVGLYRSEFFFMIRNQFPDEETQFQVYRRVLERNGNKRVTFRLLDVGGDKPLRYFDWGKEENPSLGWRSIRMLLTRTDILKPHLRALLRTCQLGQPGQARIVVPMVSQLTELRAIQEHLADCLLELETEGGCRLQRPPVGVMVEVPSAVLQINSLVREADFLCVGTNDLIQYLFAIDRGNERVAAYYQPYHPAVIRALMQIAAAASEGGTPVTVCGEMAADPLCLPILLGLGLNHLSISPASAGQLRPPLRAIDTSACRQLLSIMLKRTTAEEVKEDLEEFMRPMLLNS